MKKLIIVLAMLFSITCIYATQVGDDAINFKAKTLKDENVDLSSYKGKKAVWLVFWATWCPNCTREIPTVKQMHANYSDDIEIIAVNVGIGDSVENAKEYAKKHALPYKVIFSNDIASQYRVQGTPTQIAIDINGKIAYRGITIAKDFSKKDVKKLLKK